MTKTAREKAIDRFRTLCKKTFRKDLANFDYCPDLDGNDYCSVGVTCSTWKWEDIEPMILKLAKQSGILKYFDQSGAGTGFGVRDVGFCLKLKTKKVST